MSKETLARVVKLTMQLPDDDLWGEGLKLKANVLARLNDSTLQAQQTNVTPP
jgi:hypothetical protein